MEIDIFATLLVIDAALVAALPASSKTPHVDRSEDMTTLNINCQKARGLTINLSNYKCPSWNETLGVNPSARYTFTVTTSIPTPTTTSVTTSTGSEANSSSEARSFLSAAYFENWGIYDNSGLPSYRPEDLPVEELTHVFYAFAVINNETSTISLKDPEADLGAGADWNSTALNITAKGNVEKLFNLKQKHRRMKVLLSIGGAAASQNFSTPAARPETREKLAKSAVAVMGDWGFDGIDLDWEHEAYDKSTSETWDQADDFTQLLKVFREELNRYSKAHAPDYHFELTVAAPGGIKGIRKWKAKDMNEYVDLFNVMAYDFTGEWSEKTGHQANLYSSGDSYLTPSNIDESIKAYLDAGVPANKLLLGVPACERGFTKTVGLGQQFEDMVPVNKTNGVSDRGSVPYRSIPRLQTTTKPPEYNETIGAAWTHDEMSQTLISFDDPRVVAQKARYVKEKGLAGMFSWTARWDMEKGSSGSLTTTWFKELGKLSSTTNHIIYPASKYHNIAKTQEGR